jgi:hypothetical protein
MNSRVFFAPTIRARHATAQLVALQHPEFSSHRFCGVPIFRECFRKILFAFPVLEFPARPIIESVGSDGIASGRTPAPFSPAV